MRRCQAGDTILTETTAIPYEAKLLKGQDILHFGNTGNHHKLVGGAFGIYELDGNKYLDVTEETAYTHEEHRTIHILPGKYELSFVQEYDHFQDLQRAVVD